MSLPFAEAKPRMLEILSGILGFASAKGRLMVHPAALLWPPPSSMNLAIFPTSMRPPDLKLKCVWVGLYLMSIPTSTPLAMMVKSAMPSESP